MTTAKVVRPFEPFNESTKDTVTSGGIPPNVTVVVHLVGPSTAVYADWQLITGATYGSNKVRFLPANPVPTAWSSGDDGAGGTIERDVVVYLEGLASGAGEDVQDDYETILALTYNSTGALVNWS